MTKALIFVLPALLSLGCGGVPRVVILHDPLSAAEHIELGRSYEMQGEETLAIQQYEAALAIDKKFIPALTGLGNIHAQGGRYRNAERLYHRALKQDPHQPQVLNNLGWLYMVQGIKMKEAEALIRQALLEDPDRKPYYLDTLAELYLKEGRLEEAERVLLEAREVAAEDGILKKSLEEKFSVLETLRNNQNRRARKQGP
jgi:Tfp pilus assembly protein PilF